MFIKKSIIFTMGASLALFAVAGAASAASGSVEGLVRRVGVNVEYTSGNYVTLEAGVTAGSCSKSDNEVLFKIAKDDERGEAALRVALAAQVGGKRVRISWDDTLTSSGYCKLRSIQILPD